MATNSNSGRQWSPGPSSSTSRPSTSSATRRRQRAFPSYSPRSPTNNRARSSSPKVPAPAESHTSRPNSNSSSCSEDQDNTCAICLSKPSNKCFTDACYHSFCFSCLLEWSKVRPTCPLCQKGFRTIKHTLKDYQEYEQYDIFQHHPRPSPPLHSSSERIYIYESYQFARLNLLHRYRDLTPDFFMDNPAQTTRLIPWLNRELLALLPSPNNIQLVMELILMMICRVDITGPEMRQILDIYLRPHTAHFQHEFYSFAISPHDMPAYDRSVQYEYRPPISYQEAYERLRRHFEPAGAIRTPEVVNAPLRSRAPEFSAFRPWSPQASAQPSTNSPQPSTSGAQPQAPPLPGPSNPGPSNPGPSSPRVTLIIDSSSDDEDCQIVKVIKPVRERSPVLIDLCDSESEQDTIPAQTPPHVRDSDVQEDAQHASMNRPRSMIGAYYPGSALKTYDTDESTEEEAQNEATKRPRRKYRLSRTQRDKYARRPRK